MIYYSNFLKVAEHFHGMCKMCPILHYSDVGEIGTYFHTTTEQVQSRRSLSSTLLVAWYHLGGGTSSPQVKMTWLPPPPLLVWVTTQEQLLANKQQDDVWGWTMEEEFEIRWHHSLGIGRGMTPPLRILDTYCCAFVRSLCHHNKIGIILATTRASL